MKKLFCAGWLIALVSSTQVNAQGFESPDSTHAAVYFVRVTNFGGAVSFEYFHNDRFIGKFKGKNYLRYECPAGKQLLWVSSEDKEFLDCDLKAGETYIILINVEMGAWKARIGLEPLSADNEDFERVKKVIMSEPPVVTSKAVIDETQKKLEDRGFIKNILERFEKEWKNAENTKIVTQEMFIPAENLK